MIEMHFPAEGHDFFHISHERAGNDVTPRLLIPSELRKVPFQSRSALGASAPRKKADNGARTSSTTQQHRVLQHVPS